MAFLGRFSRSTTFVRSLAESEDISRPKKSLPGMINLDLFCFYYRTPRRTLLGLLLALLLDHLFEVEFELLSFKDVSVSSAGLTRPG